MMPGVTLRMHVNGEPRGVTIAPLATLATALRDGLGLTGTHLGCEEAYVAAARCWSMGAAFEPA